MQSPCGPGAYTLPEKETRKRTKQFNSKNTASSSKQYDLLEYQVFFSKNQPKKKTKIGGGKLEKLGTTYRCFWYTYHIQGRFGQPRTNWRRGRLQKAATTRDRCIVHMCASSVLSRRATSPAPAQLNLIQMGIVKMGPRKSKSRISEIFRPGRYSNIK